MEEEYTEMGDTVESVDGREPETQTEQFIDLDPGADLSPETAGQITAAALTRFVMLAGEAESGKTTLLTTIYEKFNESSFAEMLFAGSWTLIGWEKRCHLARIASGAEKPDTERTLGLHQRLLHLRLRKETLEDEAQDILFSDLSGEVFRLIRDSTSECQQLSLLKRADHFVLLLDGRKLSQLNSRHETITNSMALLRSCIDAGMLGPRSFVDVVFSKYDLIAAAGQKTQEFVRATADTIQNRFAYKLGRLRFHNVAARPSSSQIEYAYGISALLKSWLEDSPYFVYSPMPYLIPDGASIFDQYLQVRFPELKRIRYGNQQTANNRLA